MDTSKTTPKEDVYIERKSINKKYGPDGQKLKTVHPTKHALAIKALVRRTVLFAMAVKR